MQQPENGSVGSIAMKQVFQQMMICSDERQSRNYAVRILCQMLDISPMEQQDTQEFWKLLLPEINIDALTELYTGTVEHYIIALDGSKRERRRLESFLDLSLDIQVDNNNHRIQTIQDTLHEMFQIPELLSNANGNAWRPEKGEPLIDAHKGCSIYENGLPSILQLHLKRFNYDWQHDTMTKLNNPVHFPLSFDLSNTIVGDSDNNGNNNESDTVRCSAMESLCYELQSVIVHVGDHQSGHYYSYVRPDIRTNQWYRFNDEIVTAVTWKDVIQDSYGGKVDLEQYNEEHPQCQNDNDEMTDEKPNQGSGGRGIFQRIWDAIMFRTSGASMRTASKSPYGFGGPASSAYMLQYVRRSDIPKLFDDY